MTSERVDAREQTTLAALNVVKEFAASVSRDGLSESTSEICDKVISSVALLCGVGLLVPEARAFLASLRSR